MWVLGKLKSATANENIIVYTYYNWQDKLTNDSLVKGPNKNTLLFIKKDIIIFLSYYYYLAVIVPE